MDPRTFAASRQARLKAGDEQLRPLVREGLIAYARGEVDWMDPIIDAAAQLWLEHYEAEAPGRAHQRPMARFRTSLEDALELTDQPEEFPEPGQVDRLTKWLSTYAVNAGTTAGAFGRGIRFKRWTTMHDASVRESHRPLDGQVVPIGSTFTVDGTKLAYPGEPKGPPEIWINCRCVIMPATREGEAMTANTYLIGPDDDTPDEIDNPDIVVSDNVYAAPFTAPTLAATGVTTGAVTTFTGYTATTSTVSLDDPAQLTAAAVDPADVAVEPADEEDLVDDDPAEGEELITEIPVHGVLAPEGVSTGDGRKFAIGALSTRQLPIPLRYETVSTHGGTTSDVVTVGRVDEAWRDDATDSWRFRGALVLTKPAAQEVIDGLVDGTVRGVSIDGDDAEIEISPSPSDTPDAGEGEPADQLLAMLAPEETVFSRMRVAGLTIVAIPAFQEAYIALGHEFQEDLSPDELAAQQAALQACGCLSGWDVVDLTDTAEEDAAAALAAELLTSEDVVALSDTEITAQLVAATGASTGVTTTFAPGTHDGPGWITHPVPTARIRRYWTRGKGAAKIRWGAPGDFNRCRSQLAKYVKNPDWLAGLCANMHKEALGFWPAQHHGARVLTAAASTLRSPAARLRAVDEPAYPAEWFQNPELEHPVPLRVDPVTRRVYGYLAEWGVCHVGVGGFCQDVPSSPSDYAYFRKGLIDTTAGEQPVGTITYGTGHADRHARLAAATAHYDQPSAVRAYVNIGEDGYGIWFAGVLAPWVTDEDITAMRAIGATSGDWREVRGQLELIAAPVVNTPGFPVKALVASAGRQITLIGAGALPREADATVTVTMAATDEWVADVARRALVVMRQQQATAERAVPARQAVRQARLASARATLERIS